MAFDKSDCSDPTQVRVSENAWGANKQRSVIDDGFFSCLPARLLDWLPASLFTQQ